MLNQRRQAAQNVADRLFAVEAAIDAAVTAAAELNAVLPTARTDANLSAIVGQDALDRTAEAFISLVQARRQIIEAHHRLEETRIQIGLRTVAIGGGAQKPPLRALAAVDSGLEAAA